MVDDIVGLVMAEAGSAGLDRLRADPNEHRIICCDLFALAGRRLRRVGDGGSVRAAAAKYATPIGKRGRSLLWRLKDEYRLD